MRSYSNFAGGWPPLPRPLPGLPHTMSGRFIGETTSRSTVIRTPFRVPEIVARLGQRTNAVPTAKVALVDPVGTVTLAGTVALGLVLASATTTPPLGAGPVKVTVPVDEPPPVTLDGSSDSAAKAGGTTVSVLVCVTPFRIAEMVTKVGDATAEVITLNDPLVAPAGTASEAGTLATPGLLLTSDTVAPLAEAGPLNVTVLTTGFPPVTLGAPKLTDDNDTESAGEFAPRLKNISPLPVATTCDHAA